MGEAVIRLRADTLSVEQTDVPTGQDDASVLGALRFSAQPPASGVSADEAIPCLHVALPRLCGDEALCEVWHASEHLTSGRSGDVQFRHDEEFVFGTVSVPETRFAVVGDKTPLQQATESAYGQIFKQLDALAFPYPLRFWNYVSRINEHSHNLERYQQFNIGRQEAFLAYGRDVQGNLPAACAVGMDHGPLSIAFLAGRTPSQSVENPRQVSAFQYPSQYGPRSPSFARANLVSTRYGEVLLVSGTASIVGHATMHPGDVAAQTRETVKNIEALVAQACQMSRCGRFDLGGLACRVYVRHPGDLAAIRHELEQALGKSLKAVYLQADICRSDLLLEIEATVSLAAARRN
jgi:enamine deaminase RidA (YjgF/YER057c/UK114 family)